MKSIKPFLEKPGLIWFVIAILYSVVFWGYQKDQPMGTAETATYSVLRDFGDAAFPPKIELMKSFSDLGHLGYYLVVGRFFRLFGGSVLQLRALHLVMVLCALFLFMKIAEKCTSRNRLNPMWIAFGMLIIAVNPYAWSAAFQINDFALLLILILGSLYAHLLEDLTSASLLASFAVLVDWYGILLAASYIGARITHGESSKLIQPARWFYYVLPLLVAAGILIFWQGMVPDGDMRAVLTEYHDKTGFLRMDSLFYTLAILPIYTLWFSWCWVLRSRKRALRFAAYSIVVAAPLYFIFPQVGDLLSDMRLATGSSAGWIDLLAGLVSVEYKGLLLFIPYLVGFFGSILLAQLEILDRSSIFRWMIGLFLVSQPFMILSGDKMALIGSIFVIFFSLSEGLVGETSYSS